MTTHVSPRLRALAGTTAVAIAVLVGMSRVYLGVHWLTDVLGGAVLSAAVLTTWVAVRLFLSSHLARDGHPRARRPDLVHEDDRLSSSA